MTHSPIVARKNELIQAEIDGELVGLNVEDGTCYGFNGTATRIWTLLEQPRTLDELCSLLVGEFDVDEATCRREVAALVRELVEDGLVEASGLPPADA